MATTVIMPKQGQSVETCIITKWFRKKGEKVSAGDILFSYETDKAAFDLESPADGILLDIFYQEGSEVPVLQNVALIGQPGEAAEISTSEPKRPEAYENPVVEKAAETAAAGQASVDSRIRISPRARRFAERKGIDFSALRGSGPNGRIVCADVEVATAGTSAGVKSEPLTAVAQVPAGEYTDQPLGNVRRIIARAMHSSLSNSAQLTHHMSADVRGVLEGRKKIKEKMAADKAQQDITLNDMICWCVIRALEKFPQANSHFLGETIRTFSDVHLGLAVDTPRGLMVPALRNAGRFNLEWLSKELKSIADSCRKGSIDPALIQSTAASFTVSNLGNYGVEMFTPVINLPQTAILGVCTIIHRPADLGNNTFGFIPFIGLSLTYDHRAIDGGPATLFLRGIKEEIENFRYQS
jgi:pyruvate dehydrogenase E2 component (dihydrolipoamide acetyltransferase)